MRVVRGLALAGLILTSTPAIAQTLVDPDTTAPLGRDETLLTTFGEGVVRVTPDRATISAGVVTTAATAREAAAANAASMARVVSAVRGMGISGENLQTAQVGLEPNFRRDDNGRRLAEIDGYVATNRVTVVVQDLAKASNVVTALFDSGANSVSGPDFGLTDDAAVVRRARDNAMADARMKAQDYANGFGLRVARVLRIDDTSNFVGLEPMNYSPNQFMASDDTMMAVPIEPGQLTSSARVGVRFVLAPK